MIHGQIIKSIGGLYDVETESGIWSCKPRGLFRKQGISPYVGDTVSIEPLENNTGYIIEIDERKNHLIRPPVANLDYMVSVVSTSDPVPNYVTLDKFLAVMESHHVPTLIVITKPDLGDSSSLRALYSKVGYPVYIVNNETKEGLEELRQVLGTGLCAFSGNTGVGKSSLLNSLAPELELEVGETSKKLGRGRHTTRHVEIYSLPNGLRVADTPGFSSMDLSQTAEIEKETLADCFIDFRPYAGECKFRDCKHLSETGCKIIQKVKEKEIIQSRYDSYLQIYDEIKDVKEWEKK